MPKRSSRDLNETAFSIVQQSTGQAAPVPSSAPAKNPAAVALGRLGGLKGGNHNLSYVRRIENEKSWQKGEIRKKMAVMRHAQRTL